MNTEYHKLASYENLKGKLKDLLWNDMKQVHIRCNIYNDIFDTKGGESMAEH